MSVHITRVTRLKSLATHRYRNVNVKLWNAITRDAKALRGIPVIHINSAVHGGGVAELLRSQIPFERALGLDSRWYTISAPPAFFKVTKKIHNLLQGAPGRLSDSELRLYKKVGVALAKDFTRVVGSLKRGIIIVHDPQPAALLYAIPSSCKSVWRLHIDLSHANPWAVNLLREHSTRADRVVVSSALFTRALRGREHIIQPAIDPFVAKNKLMALTRARSILRKLGIHDDWPIVVQVSRFDVWKDPIGVVRAYYVAKKTEPKLQLVLAGLMTAQDDPEALEMLRKVRKYVKGDNNIHLFSSSQEIHPISNDELVNALHTIATVVVQKSTREGFGLTITEAMWKRRVVVAAPSAGALSQIQSNKNGFITTTSQEMGRMIAILIRDKKTLRRVGVRAREHVKKYFLFPRYMRDCVRLYTGLRR